MLENLVQIVGEPLIDRRRFLGGLVGGGLMLTTGGYCVGAEEGKKDGKKSEERKEKPRLKWQDYIKARPGIQKMLSQAEKLSQLTLELDELIEKNPESDKQIIKDKYEELAKEKSKFDEWIRSNFVIGKDGKETRDIPVPFVGNDYRNSKNRNFKKGELQKLWNLSRDLDRWDIGNSNGESKRRVRNFWVGGIKGINKVVFGSNEPFCYGIFLDTRDFQGSTYEVTIWNPNDELVDWISGKIHEHEIRIMRRIRADEIRGDKIIIGRNLSFCSKRLIPYLEGMAQDHGEGDYSVVFLVDWKYLARRKFKLIKNTDPSEDFDNPVDMDYGKLDMSKSISYTAFRHLGYVNRAWKDPIQYLNKDPKTIR